MKLLPALFSVLLPVSGLAQSSTEVQGTTFVTVDLKSAGPDEIFAALGKAGGVTFVPPGNWGRGNLIRISLDLKNQAFWAATLQMGGAFGYTFDTGSFSPWDRRIRINLSPPLPARQILIATPLVLMAEISKNKRSAVDLVAYADPSLKDWVFAEPPEVTEANDEGGESVLGKPDEQLPAPPGLVSRHSVPLTKTVAKLASLKGTFILITATAVEPWDIALPVAIPAVKKIDKTTYTVVSMTKSQNRYELKLRVKGPADGGFRAGAADLVVGTGSIIASDAAGKAWRISDVKGSYKSRKITATGDYDYTLTLIPERASGSTEITKLTWRIPTAMDNLEVPFEFKDVPLK